AGSLGPPDGLVEASHLEETPERRLADPDPLGEDAILVQDLMEELDRERPVLDAVAGDDLGRIVVELAEAALVGTCLGQECIEPIPLVGAQPAAQRRDAEAL